MASSLKVANAEVVAGKYRVRANFDAEDERQMSVMENEYVTLQEQTEERGWVWAQKDNNIGGKSQGYIPKNFLEKIPEGDWDQWAYGCELVACFYSFVSGLFILLYGSANKVDPAVELAVGCLGMMLASLLMIVVFFRTSIQPLYRAFAIIVVSIPAWAGYPVGIWGAIFCFLAALVEILVWFTEDDDYVPQSFSCNRFCLSIFGASLFNIVIFCCWVAMNIGIFIWGLEYGKERAEGWSNPDQQTSYKIPTGEWSFAQSMAQCMCFQIFCLLIFSLQGFQQVILALISFETQRQGKLAQFKRALLHGFSRESMLRVHKFISYTIMFCATFHVLGCFATYEHSGSERDYLVLFGEAPTITGGLLIIVLGVVISSAFIPHDRQPEAFRYVHYTSILFIGLLVLHGRNWFAPNFWKWMIAPMILYAMDKSLRYGVFGVTATKEPYYPGDQAETPQR